MKLFEKSSIGNMTLKNRIVMAPMGKAADADGSMTETAVNYFLERAKGGVGLIITNGFKVGFKYESAHGQALSSLNHVSRLYMMTEQAHGYGTKVCAQIITGMGRISYVDPFTPPRSAGNNPCLAHPEMMCKPLEIDEIKDLVKMTGYSAKLALMAGVDAIDYIVGGGYLNDEFMTPCWNDRTDEYGGSLENRLRFTLECIAEIKKNIGNKIPLMVKFTPCHYLPNGRTMEEGLEIAKILEKAGVDAFHVDLGTWDNLNYVVPSVYDEVGLNIEAAEKIKSVVSVPVLSSGKLSSDIDQTEEFLQQGKTDYILVGRQLLADPEWANKVKENRREDIRPCIRCSECWRTRTSGLESRCAVNPLCNAETVYQLGGKLENKKVLVVGGGPGGCYAACAAADRGCDVVLVEKTDKLGGRIQAAAAPGFKREMRPYIDYMRREVEKRSNITVKYNTELKAEDVAVNEFDKIIIATGALNALPPIPGIEHTSPAEDYLYGKKTAGNNVVIIGGGFVGAETAAFLQNENNSVTVIEMLDVFLANANDAAINKFGIKKLMAEKQFDLKLGARVTGITENTVTYVQNGETKTINADTIINATGYKTDAVKLEDALSEKCDDISVIGDAYAAPRKIFNAIHEAHHVVRALR